MPYWDRALSCGRCPLYVQQFWRSKFSLHEQPGALRKARHAAQVAHNEKAFLKGLTVVDDVAYFGIGPPTARASRADPSLTCEIAAFHLLEGRLLWRRKVRDCTFYYSAAVLGAAQTVPWRWMAWYIADGL